MYNNIMCFLFILLVAFSLINGSFGVKLTSPAVEFTRHTVVEPIVHHARTKREILTTEHQDGVHHSDVTVTLPVEDEEYVLDLTLNKDLLPDNHLLRYQKNGETVIHKPTTEDVELCQYSGGVRGRPRSWAALSTCRGVRGLLFDGQRLKYIEPAEGHDSNLQSKHYIYDHAHLNSEHRCGHAGAVVDRLYDENNNKSRPTKHKRNADVSRVRGPYDANRRSRYVELALVADHREFLANGDLRTVHRQMKDVANIINSLFAPLNIYIALVEVVVWNEKDLIELNNDDHDTLQNFLRYRESMLKEMPNDNAQLLTGQKFGQGVLNKAIIGPMCSNSFSGGVNYNHSTVIGLVATTIAHSIGHNFGMKHDSEESCKCPDEKCIMSQAITSSVAIHWSSCSVDALVQAFGLGVDYCLRNKPNRLFASPTCGNGFTEPGEQCDCGSTGWSPCHACCQPDTCMLRANATCGAGACCDLETCRPTAAGKVCRSAEGECDLPEFCTGQSEFCPDDIFKMDTTLCVNGGEPSYCWRGACRSHAEQCRLLWGSATEVSHDECYQLNVFGKRNGNCGYDSVTKKFSKCEIRDVYCGILQCNHDTDELKFGIQSDAWISSLYLRNNGSILKCSSVILELGVQEPDPGMVPDGAMCGDGKMCLNHKCVEVEELHQNITKLEGSVCPSNCSGHGVCNSKGHCHCDAGYSPPLCAPSPAGSVDSEPNEIIATSTKITTESEQDSVQHTVEQETTMSAVTPHTTASPTANFAAFKDYVLTALRKLQNEIDTLTRQVEQYVI